jgi:YjbE family integral membrane protein
MFDLSFFDVFSPYIQFLWPLLAVVAIDLVMAGDNAIIIGAIASGLPPEVRQKAIYWGTAAAVLVRVAATVFLTILLASPWVLLVGGLYLVWVAAQMFGAQEQANGPSPAGRLTLRQAVWSIVLADTVMGVDNMVAVGGAAHGSFAVIMVGLAVSIPIMVVGASLIAHYISSHPWIITVGALLIVHTGLEMVAKAASTFYPLPLNAIFIWAGASFMTGALFLFSKWRVGGGNVSE